MSAAFNAEAAFCSCRQRSLQTHNIKPECRRSGFYLDPLNSLLCFGGCSTAQNRDVPSTQPRVKAAPTKLQRACIASLRRRSCALLGCRCCWDSGVLCGSERTCIQAGQQKHRCCHPDYCNRQSHEQKHSLQVDVWPCISVEWFYVYHPVSVNVMDDITAATSLLYVKVRRYSRHSRIQEP